MKREDCWYSSVCNNICSDTCIRYNEMKFLMDNSGIPKPQQLPLKLVPTNDQDRQVFVRLNNIKHNIVDWVENGNNLYIASESAGVAKTSWALKLMLRYFDEIWSGNGFKVRGMFIHTPTFLSQLKNFQNPLTEEYKNNVMNTDLVIWDDIATGKTSDYDYTQLLMYIDNRLLNKKSNIYTSNIINRNSLEKMLGGRLASRIYGESEPLIITAGDYRGAIYNIKKQEEVDENGQK